MTRPDPLTPEERAAVNAKIKAKQVTVLPMGGTSFEYPRWDGQKLVLPEGENTFRRGMNRFHGKNATPAQRRVGQQRAKPPVQPAIASRRDQVAALHAQGKTIVEIIAAMGDVTNSAVRFDLQQLGLTPHVWTNPRVVDHAARERRIREMAAQGMTADEISDALPLALDSTRKLAKKYGLTLARKTRTPKPKASPFRALGDLAQAVVEQVKKGKRHE